MERINMKYCKKCETDKQESEFRASKTTKDKLFAFCKLCQDKVNKELYQRKREERIEQVRDWNNAEENIELVKGYKKKWAERNK